MEAVARKPHRRILLVEDSGVLVRTLSDLLRAEGYDIDVREDGKQGLEAASNRGYDLVLLDIMLPSMNGFEIAESMRRRGVETPILMLTALEELKDRVHGLRSGADDYLTKPFEVDELLARVEAGIRRSRNVEGRYYDFGGMRVDFARNLLIREDQTVELSEQETRLLQYFIHHRSRVISRETLLQEVWGYKAAPITRTVDVHISSLRQKMRADYKSRNFILTVHSRGYRFEG